MLSLPLSMSEIRIPTMAQERFWLLSNQQQFVPETYRNEILSQDDWIWRGNVLIIHECGDAACDVICWVSENLDAIRSLLRCLYEM